MGDQIELLVHNTSNLVPIEDSKAQPEDKKESTPFHSDTVKYPPEQLGHGVPGVEAPFIPRPPMKPKPRRQSRLQHLHSLESMQSNRKAKIRSSEESSSEHIDTDSSCGSLYGDFSGSPMPCLQDRSTVASQKLLSRSNSSSSSSSSSMRDCDISQSASSMTEYRNSPNPLDSEPKQPSSDKTISSARRRLPPVVHTKPLPPITVNIESPALRTSNRIDSDYADYIHVTRKELSNQHNHFYSPSQGTEDSRSSFSMSSSSSILFPVRSEDLRNRSYLEGSLLASGALLGASELDRYFPDRRIRVFIATWNMQGQKELPDTLDDLLLPYDCHYIHDLYVIGTQEGIPDKREWEIRLQEILGPYFVLLYSAVHGVLQLSMFIRRDLIWFCSEVEQATVTTRIISQIKTKGAVGISFTFFGTSFLFISSHFTSGPGKVYERMLDYNKTIEALALPRIVPDTNVYRSDPNDVTTRFDNVFWFGDFNFRLDVKRAVIDELLHSSTKDNLCSILHYDELTKKLQEGSVFKGFKEAEINFPPTYKFDIGCDVYDSSAKKRTPSYTHPIVCRSVLQRYLLGGNKETFPQGAETMCFIRPEEQHYLQCILTQHKNRKLP
ncbi:phosphatidylinositol polyphosphate 5-phosphatase type IV isoform X2 [Pristis pectinata]|uniref:phosphatidylinositol polyphosphate 5-phosphatase type IV isoform X2 n=1 Tax=Pristis pectinata TaxID=685728 RepID=UPI00223CABD0|nr:phosphatidylinositol polyphosphate 5-phosphatase type IV isoform X2 [Pristis pectinata]